MKKRIILIGIIVVLLILLFPIPFYLKDGGTVEHRALLYTVTKYHKLVEDDEYMEGTGIKILGKEVYNSTNQQKMKNEDFPYFYGTVIESNSQSIIVEPREGASIRKSADNINRGWQRKKIATTSQYIDKDKLKIYIENPWR